MKGSIFSGVSSIMNFLDKLKLEAEIFSHTAIRKDCGVLLKTKMQLINFVTIFEFSWVH